jgi:predicted metal-binding protein
MLRRKALELGADDAAIVAPEGIPVQEEIVRMCKSPGCEGYGRSAHCPPHVMKPDEARKWIRNFSAALLFKIHVSPALLVSEDRFAAFRKIYELAAALEGISSEAGHVRSAALAAGSCKPVFCKGVPCESLAEGGRCRVPDLARPSMEALGINVFETVRAAGWEIQPILRDTDPESVTQGMLAGLVLIA